MIPIGREVESASEGSASVVGTRSRQAFGLAHVKPCACPWELREEHDGMRCARCDARVFALRVG